MLEIFIITFLTKNMAVADSDMKHIIKLTDLENELDEYVTSDFFRKKIGKPKLSELNPFEFEEIEVNSMDWLVENKQVLLGRIHTYLMLYSELMPNNVLRSLVEIELLITREPVFEIFNQDLIRDRMSQNIIDDSSIQNIKKQLSKFINKVLEFERII